MVNMADVNDSNRLENLIGEDLDPKWNEPSTRGDLRLLAIRIDTKFDQVRSDFHTFKSGVDSQFEQSRSDIRVLVAETNSKVDNALAEFARTMYRGGMIFAGAIITANLAMLSIFATLIR